MLLIEPRISKTAAQWKESEGVVIAARYRLAQFLGSSEDAAVFLTTRPGGEPGVIKLVCPESEEAGARKVRDWQQASALTHPHLARLFDQGRAMLDGAAMVYVVTEYAEENLAQILPERALTPEEAREMLTPVLAALNYLHGKGFAHTRLKPANVLAVGNCVKLSADSLLRVEDAGSKTRRPSAYDAPEARANQWTGAADVWSLGATLCEALTQRRPEGMEAAVPSAASMPAPFDAIVGHCLVRDRDERWTVAQISSALNRPALNPEFRPVAPAVAARAAATEIVSPQAKAAFLRRSDPDTGLDLRRLLLWIGAALVVVMLIAAVVGRRRSGITNPATVAPAPAAGISPSAAAPSEPVVAPKAMPARGDTPVVHETLPQVSHAAAVTITGTVKVRVRVNVDANGRVTDASLAHPVESKYFERLALASAREWEFAPSGAASHTVQFDFKRNSTSAHLVN